MYPKENQNEPKYKQKVTKRYATIGNWMYS